jgi:hypothetical protein
MSGGAALPAVLLVFALASAIGALRCLADRLLASAAIYTALGAGLAVAAAKVALDAI